MMKQFIHIALWNTKCKLCDLLFSCGFHESLLLLLIVRFVFYLIIRITVVLSVVGGKLLRMTWNVLLLFNSFLLFPIFQYCARSHPLLNINGWSFLLVKFPIFCCIWSVVVFVMQCKYFTLLIPSPDWVFLYLLETLEYTFLLLD